MIATGKLELRFAGKWYKIKDVRYSAGITLFEIEDEPGHRDFAINPEIVR